MLLVGFRPLFNRYPGGKIKVNKCESMLITTVIYFGVIEYEHDAEARALG